ncbi:ChrR Cupin-like domain-containing protein [Lentzea fradiae]|uniref:ChrR Cupin-like domain-containing protein n=1 Tax=Lentzea fradiae TaxID=200378 RepID=A0A1G7R3G9_9PSEU|nr:cupin domain-containing protein [Lentzea fradiae]SDG05277.1 ChrR Cupin-like domain-containing protein [Lentzea fradiae]
MRPYVSLPRALADAEGVEGPRVLTQDPESGCTTMLWSLPANTVAELGVPGYDAEYFLVSGRLCDRSGTSWPEHAYRTVRASGSLAVSAAEPAVLLRRTLPATAEPMDELEIDPRERSWVEVAGGNGGAGLARLPLRWQVGRGDCSLLVRFEPGWVSPHGRHAHSTFEECLVLTGTIETDTETSGPGSYVCKPPGTPQSPPRAPGGALVWISHGGAMDFRPVT